jgi:hypothetical protein
MANTNSYDNVRIYGDTDTSVFIAPKGSTLPVVLGAPTTPFEALGWLGDDGTPLALAAEVAKFKAYQGGALLRVKVTSTEKSFTVQCAEENPVVTGLYFDHGDATITGTAPDQVAKVDLPESVSTVERACVVRWLDGTVEKLLCCPLVQIGERAEVPHKGDALTVYGMTFSIIGDCYLLTNAAAYVA